MLKKRKPTKALEKCAREVKNADVFVEHVANIADRYRREHALDSGSRNSDARKSLREFHKHAAVLAAWLQQAHKTQSVEHDALNKMSSALHAASLAYAQSKAVQGWLAQAEKAAANCIADTKLLPRKSQAMAPRITAEALRATFEYHKLKWSAAVTKQKQSDAVKLLCAIAKSAGDAVLTPEIARAVLRETNGKAQSIR